MNDIAIGYLVLGIGIVGLLGVVFVVASREGPPTPRPAVSPPRGVHLPGPSALPVLMAVAGSLIAAGLVFAPDGAVGNWFLLGPGLLVFVGAIVAWVRAANHEWRETEHGSHDDRAEH
ncbi:MAG: hypothetical protein ACRDGV_10225 [Candidatus Limnocylindria bacterium]